MVVRDDLDGLLNQLVALILELLPVSVLASIDTATEVVVLWRWRWRSRNMLVCLSQHAHGNH